MMMLCYKKQLHKEEKSTLHKPQTVCIEVSYLHNAQITQSNTEHSAYIIS